MNLSTREHWEKVYRGKRPDEVSWYQENPKTSLDFIHALNPAHDSRIIDVGGGESRLIDALLAEGFTDLTVLDISEGAIGRAKARLGAQAERVKWIVSDVIEFEPERPYDIWHDRATFHFLTDQALIERYVGLVGSGVRKGGHLILATFSTSGPKSCSGLPVHQYSEDALSDSLRGGFEKVRCITEDHITPSGASQNFLFCIFRRL